MTNRIICPLTQNLFLKRIIFISLFMSGSMAMIAQTYIDIPWRDGFVVIDGVEMSGMIRLGGDLNAPWLNHSKVYFVTNEIYAETKNHPRKKEITEYEPEDIEGYSTYTEDADKNRIDLTFISGEVTYMNGLAKKKQVVFLQILDLGAINTFKYIPMAEKESTADLQYQAGQRALLASTIYFKKGDSAYLSAAKTEIADLVAECPDVLSKVQAGSYGFVDLSQRTKKKGLGGLMASQAGDNQLEDKICISINEYNACVN